MGIDLLDLTFRIEREFDIRLYREDLMRLLNQGNTADPPKGAWTDIRVTDYAGLVEAAIQQQHSQPQRDTYGRVKQHIVECLGVDELEVSPEAWIVRDLGME